MDEKNIVDILHLIAEELMVECWRRVDRGRERIKTDPDDKWIDYHQGVIHGLDEGAQKIYDYIERIERGELI